MTLAAAALLLVMGPAGQQSPRIVLPERPPIFWFHGDLPCAELTGFDAFQSGKPIEGPPFQLREGAPLELTLYWRALQSEPGGAEVGVNVRSPGVGPGPGHYKRYPVKTREAWRAGNVCTQRIVHTLPKGTFAGEGYLNLFLTRPGATASDWAWLYRAPAAVLPLKPQEP